MGKNRIRQLDLIRMISTWGIFTFHFFVNRSSLFGAVGTHGGYTGGDSLLHFLCYPDTALC